VLGLQANAADAEEALTVDTLTEAQLKGNGQILQQPGHVAPLATPMPTSIKVGPYVYRVDEDEREIRKFEHNRSGAYGGCTDHALQTIHIDPTLAPTQRRETLWHEVKHCVVYLFQWDGKKAEEEAIRMMAPMELAVLRDNPELVAYLLEP